MDQNYWEQPDAGMRSIWRGERITAVLLRGGMGMEPNEPGAVLQEAFRMGESKDDGNRRKSIALYQTIIKENPAHFTGWYNLGVIQYRMGEWQEALKSFSEAEKCPGAASGGRLCQAEDHDRQRPDDLR